MHRLNSSQKESVRSLQEVTNASESKAISMLKKYNWNLPQAVEAFFVSSPSPEEPYFDFTKVQTLFDKYKDKTGNAISENGLQNMISDLEVPSDDISLFILAWQCGCKTLGEFSRKEFLDGVTRLRCDSITSLKERLPSLRAEITEDSAFKDFYTFMFDYAKEDTSKNLSLEMAIEMWKIILKDRFPRLDKWIAFLQEKYNKSISRDTWNQLLEFIKTVNNDLDNYDPEGAWPVVIDDFVEYLRQSE